MGAAIFVCLEVFLHASENWAGCSSRMVPSLAEACLSPGPLLSCGSFSSFVSNSSPNLLKCLYRGSSHVWSSGFLMQTPLLYLAPWEVGLKMLLPSVKSWLELGWEFYKELMNITVQYMFKSWAIPLSIRVCHRCWAAEQSGGTQDGVEKQGLRTRQESLRRVSWGIGSFTRGTGSVRAPGWEDGFLEVQELIVLLMYTYSFFKIFFNVDHFLKSLLNLLQYCFYFMSWIFGHEACLILAPWLGIEPHLLPWKGES